MISNIVNCPIWGTFADLICNEGEISNEHKIYNSPRAGGRFKISNEALKWLPARLSQQENLNAKLTTWILDNQSSNINYLPNITLDTIEDVINKKLLSYRLKKESLFVFLKNQLEIKMAINFIDVHIYFQNQDKKFNELNEREKLILIFKYNLAASFESLDKNMNDWKNFYNVIKNEGYFLEKSTYENIILSEKSFFYFEELENRHQKSKNVFVAMWFNPSMDDAYDKGIKQAIKQCHLEPVRVDRDIEGEQLGKIDDHIIAKIRGSRFVIADFTCESTIVNQRKEYFMRGGVYYEAGFAKGLGREVIWTCREDAIDGVHFDTRQFNHILWKTPEDLKNKLIDRIVANNLNY